MPAIITNKFRIHNSEQFSESFSEASPNVYYLAIGRPQAFATQTRGDSRTDNQGTDAAPLTPVDSIQDEFYTFDDLLAVKKIITIAKEYNGMAKVASGITAGEKLITEGYDLINEGDKITVKK